MNLKDVSEIAYNLLTSVAVAFTAVWAYRKFVIFRERYPRVEFELDLRILGQQQGKYVVELLALVTNKGFVRHTSQNFYFSLFYLTKDDKVENGDKNINCMLKFNDISLMKKRSWFPIREEDYTFIDAGTTQRYSYVTYLPGDATFALLQSKFYYDDKESDFHSAQKCFKVEAEK